VGLDPEPRPSVAKNRHYANRCGDAAGIDRICGQLQPLPPPALTLSEPTISQSAQRGQKIAQTIGVSLFEKFNQ